MSPRTERNREIDLVTFSSKIDPELYRRAKIAAVTQGKALQDVWDEALREWLDRHPVPLSEQ